MKTIFCRVPPRAVKEVQVPTGPFTLDPKLIEEIEKLCTPLNLGEVKKFDLAFLNDDVNIPTLSPADIRAKIVPLSPPKPLNPNMSILGLSSCLKLDKYSRKQEPVMSYIQQISSPDLRTAYKGLQQMIEYFQSASKGCIEDHEDDFMKAIVTQLKYLRNQDVVEDAEVAKVYRSVLTIVDAVCN